MNLLIDDYRNYGYDIIARSAEAGKAILEELFPRIETLGIDHDLGIGDTGYDIVCWALNKGVLPDRVQVVSSNPVGRQRIAAALLNAGYKQKSSSDFVVE